MKNTNTTTRTKGLYVDALNAYDEFHEELKQNTKPFSEKEQAKLFDFYRANPQVNPLPMVRINLTPDVSTIPWEITVMVMSNSVPGSCVLYTQRTREGVTETRCALYTSPKRFKTMADLQNYFVVLLIVYAYLSWDLKLSDKTEMHMKVTHRKD
jgi:hypothetical protein